MTRECIACSNIADDQYSSGEVALLEAVTTIAAIAMCRRFGVDRIVRGLCAEHREMLDDAKLPLNAVAGEPS